MWGEESRKFLVRGGGTPEKSHETCQDLLSGGWGKCGAEELKNAAEFSTKKVKCIMTRPFKKGGGCLALNLKVDVRKEARTEHSKCSLIH